MYLQLFIDDILIEEWYLDETVEFRDDTRNTKPQNQFRREKLIQQECLEIRQAYWSDIESCHHWEIVLRVKSKLNRREYFQQYYQANKDHWSKRYQARKNNSVYYKPKKNKS